MSYWDTRVLVRLDHAECVGATWLLELRMRSGRGAPGGPPERTLRRSTSAEYKRFILAQSAMLQKCLDLRSIGLPDSRLRICPEQAVDMASGLDALIAMRRRLIAKQWISRDKEASSSATMDLTGGTPVAGEPVEPKQSEEKIPSPQSSLAKKRKRVPREVTEEFDTSVNALEKGFDLVPFVDQYLMTQEAEEALDGIKREVARIPKLQNMLSEKENRIKTLGFRVTELEAEAKSRGAEVRRLERLEKTLNEKFKAAENKAIEFEASLKKAHEHLVSMEKAKVEAEMSALTTVADIEKTMLEQVSLLAPMTDFSKVSAYNKVVDGQIVEAPGNELPEVLSSRVPE
ncbi:hypothetical protein PIB30_099171 [Stylosanthes scabra]|uniref:Uncharacterized protein n=1 Tax=Stylosanthes scabra TaxID=79078 RepID=A0ABU6WZD4_9FABA|nr:hypothetical protein [Stylosanthes scabra]